MNFHTLRHSRAGFTLVEILVGLLIFSIGITGIFLLLESTIKSSAISRSEIIVANLLREQIELVRNVRDTNIANYARWDLMPNTITIPGGPYTIENDFTKYKTAYVGSAITESPVIITPINESSWNDLSIKQRFEKTQLFFDEKKRYIHENAFTNTAGETAFASYFFVHPMTFSLDGKEITPVAPKTDGTPDRDYPQGYVVDARVISKIGNTYREYDARTIITDWTK